jgi:hypothetical protein
VEQIVLSVEEIDKLGAVGIALTTTLFEATDEQLESLVTTNVYVVLANKFPKFVVVPEPEIVAPPGDAVIVQFPVAGKPLKATLAELVQVGCVMVPTTGALGLLNDTFTVAIAFAHGETPLTV